MAESYLAVLGASTEFQAGVSTEFPASVSFWNSYRGTLFNALLNTMPIMLAFQIELRDQGLS